MKVKRWLFMVSAMLLLLGCSDGNHASPKQTQVETNIGTQREADAKLEAVKEKFMDPVLRQQLLEKKEQSKPVTGLFRTSLDAVLEDGEAKLSFSFENISENNLRLFFGSGQTYDIFVLNEQGDEVYRWSHDKSFIAAIIERDVKKDESLQFSEVWNLEDSDGEPVPDGIYRVKVAFMGELKSQEGSAMTISPDERTASAIVDIRR